MMVRIAICDDLQEQLDLIQKAVQQYFHDKKEPTEVFTYNNAMDFVDAFEKEGNFDIVLLDICMPGLLGTDIAAEMRKQKSRAEIVFLSTSEEFAVEAFAVRAAHYLVKPFTQKEFDQAMDRVMESIRQRHSGKMIFRLVGGGIQVEEVNAILYVESNGHIQQVYTADHSLLETRQSLASLLDTLDAIAPGQFVSPGKGYIVNQSAIRVIKSDYIEIQGHKIPLAKRKYRQFQESYLKYLSSGRKPEKEVIMKYNHVTPAVVADLEAIVGAKYVWTDRDKKIPYGQDEGTGAACLPDVVVLPASAEELAAVVRLANDAVIPVIPRGTGTGLEGGAVADSRGGIVVSTERMDRIVEINEDAMYMVVQAGIITARIQEEARKRGLLYAGDPCSGDCCCIGGNGATNAGGNRAVKYGTTRDQIYAIEVVTPDRLQPFMERLRDLEQALGVVFRGVSHAGDGNIHLDVLRKGFADEGDEKQKVAAFEDKACQAAYELGGAISGEHGIGQARKALFAKYTDPVELALMKAVKQAWDPKNILNPGKIFD